ncbi:MAG: LysM peptidoglycan-binding domain-containing protein [Parcubacteria group bacterium]|nr:LysM peptidoglycan-binding domain-containing protein [Parcubacteria group bacterium]
MAFAGFNVYAKDNDQPEDKDTSILLGFLAGQEKDNYEIVTNNLDRKKSRQETDRFSIVSVASATANSPASLTTATAGRNLAAKEQNQELSAVGGNTLVKTSPTDTTISYKPRTDVTTYNVREGDTIHSIANKFGIDAATILTESGKYADDIIKSGDKLTILPVSGTTERVDSGETLTGIAKKHGADKEEIMAFNELINDTDIEVGQILVVPDGKRKIENRPQPEVDTSTRYAYNSTSTSNQTSSVVQRSQTTPTVNKGSRVGNRFSWGWCTWYVAERRGDVSWRGNAGTWLNNARAQGRATGRTPAKGAILVTSESWWGHVAVVESVQGDRVTISEMNYKGFGITSTRTISNSSGVIKGYIY